MSVKNFTVNDFVFIANKASDVSRLPLTSVLGAVHMSRASPANRADSILSSLMGGLNTQGN